MDAVVVAGYATFIADYDKRFAPWFSEFENALTVETAESSERLKELRRLLRILVERLDPDDLAFKKGWKRSASDSN